MLNWIVRGLPGPSITLRFEPYTPQEVGQLRQYPLNEVVQYRAQLLADIASANLRE